MAARTGRQTVAASNGVQPDRRSARDDSWLAFFDAGLKTLQTLETYLASGEQSKRAKDHGCFGHISLDAKKFLRDLHKARAVLSVVQPRMNSGRFLDIGCGVGLKVQLASHVFPVAHGLEFDKGYFSVAQRIRYATLSYGVDFFHGDALKFNDFGSYDVVYLYRPMKAVAKQSALEDRLAADVKKEAIVIAHLCSFDRFSRRKKDPDEIGLELLFDTIYVNTSERRIQRIREQLAAQTGHLSTLWW